jgi:hypothetical protein
MTKTKKSKIFKVKTSKNNKKLNKTKKSNKKMKGGTLDLKIMETPFNIPAKSYPLKNSKEDIKRYSDIMIKNGFEESSIELLIKLLNKTTHISFNQLIDSIKITIKKFEKEIGEASFYLFIPIIDDKPIQHKSNYWISKIFYLLMNKKPIGIITSFKELTDEMKNIIVCDDAIYSGQQMSQTFKNFDEEPIDKHLFHILCPFISEASMERLYNMDQFNKNFYYTHIMKTFLDVYKDNEDDEDADFFEVISLFSIKRTNYPIYFDHRVADTLSSFAHVYELGRICLRKEKKCIYLNSLLTNCQHADIMTDSKINDAQKLMEKCPPIPYRKDITSETPNIRSITPEEFLREFNR